MNILEDHPLVLEIADRCNDVDYDDFNKSSYLESIYRAEKKIALEYDILNRILYFSNKIVVPPEFEGDANWLQVQKDTSFEIPIKSLHNETRVIINGILYTKATKDNLTQSTSDLLSYEYHLYYGNNRYMMNYTERGLDDTIIIHFTSDINISDYEEESIKPVLPPKFEDEILNRSCTDMAKKGIAKFKGDKGDKWYKVFKLYSKDKIALEKVESQSWITVQPFDPFRGT